MKKYNLFNNISGWIVFLIATTVYALTIEPTTSFWDCGEFIATAFKLEVGHPPGAPFFMILANFFSQFAGNDVTKVAMMINMLSALASSFTILFLFWTITHLAKKFFSNEAELSPGKGIAILGSGIVGALAYTFSDTFWFSAVEGEVYALSSLFTAVVFWAILKWENASEQKYANRWIILIAYLMGLSIGVHLLNLLALPAIVFVYYFKKNNVTAKGIILAGLISVVLLASLMYGVIPGVIKIASKFELLFVNGLGMPFNSGLLIYLFILAAVIVLGIYFSNKGNRRVLNAIFLTVSTILIGIPFLTGGWFLALLIIAGVFLLAFFLLKDRAAVVNTILLSFIVILIGYSSFSMIVIRSLANPPMDENNPENVFALLSYLNREQYGDRPLFYGQTYNAPLVAKKRYNDGDPIYIQKDGKYVVADKKQSPNYNPKFNSLFPRMYSGQARHVKAYKHWGNVEGRDITAEDSYGKSKKFTIPTFGENLTYFFRYQLNHMYFRYFMWNFAGRQNDIQGHGELYQGNWVSGIPFIDGIHGDLPPSKQNNKANNNYYLFPLLLGLLGLVYHSYRKKKDFWVVMLLFFFTGIAIVIYLNQSPYQPRERDYAYAGSFYAFAIWIGLGVLAIFDIIRKGLPGVPSAFIATIPCLFLVPGLLASENWDDHDRSGRYTARDFARNYLESCAPNAILFTNGDNDTFPLWYAQEVEGIRTDIRVVNLSLLNTDWYIDQAKRAAYNSAPVPFSLTHDKYVQGTRDVVYIIENEKLKGKYIDIDKIMEFVASDNPNTRLPQDPDIDYIPTKTISVSVDSASIAKYGVVAPEDLDKIIPEIKWNLKKSHVTKSELMILDLLATNNWERPVYWAITVGHSSYLNLEKYFQLEGLTYRLVPIVANNKDGQTGRINTKIMYDNMINDFTWGGINDTTVYLDENNIRMTMNLRNNFARLANALLDEGKTDSAIVVLDKCLEVMPHRTIAYNYFMIGIAEAYYRANEIEKANDIVTIFADITVNDASHYLNLDKKYRPTVDSEIEKSLRIMNNLILLTRKYKQPETGQQLNNKFSVLYDKFYGKTIK